MERRTTAVLVVFVVVALLAVGVVVLAVAYPDSSRSFNAPPSSER